MLPASGTVVVKKSNGDDWLEEVLDPSDIDAVSQTEFITTSGDLQSQIDSNDSDISTLQSDLSTASGSLQSQIDENDTDIFNLQSDLSTASGSLQSQITSNDGDISSLQSNLTSASGTLQSQITSNDGDISNLQSDLSSASGTLQTQIDGNDLDISNLQSDLFTASGSLQSQIDSNDADIAQNALDISTASGTLQSEIDNLTASDIAITTTGVGYSDLEATGPTVQNFTDTLMVKLSRDVQLDNFELIKSLDDFPAPVGSVISLSGSTVYLINGDISLGSNRIETARDTVLMGLDSTNATLRYTGSGDMISSSSDPVSDTVTVKNLTIISPTAGSRVFNLEGAPGTLVEIKDCSFGAGGPSSNSVNSLGFIETGSLLSFTHNVISYTTSGLTISGTTGHPSLTEIDNNKFIANPDSHVSLTVLSGAYDHLEINANLFEMVPSGAALYIEEFGSNLSSASIFANSFANGDPSSQVLTGPLDLYNNVYWEAESNIGLRDTLATGFVTFSGNSTATIIGNTTSFYKAAGTTTPIISERFDTSVSNRLEFLGLDDKIFTIDVTGSIAVNGLNQVLEIAIFKYDSATANLIRIRSVQITTGAANNSVGFALTDEETLSTNDYIELHVRNTTQTKDITVREMQFRVRE